MSSSSCCVVKDTAAEPASSCRFASLPDDFQLLVREIVSQRVEADAAEQFTFPSDQAEQPKSSDPTPLRRRYERLKRDFNERVDQKAGFYRRYARQFLDPHIEQLKLQHSHDMDAQKERYEEQIRALKRQLAEERAEVEHKTSEFYMTKKFDLERKEARRRVQELELKINKLESDSRSKDSALLSMHEARRREKAEVKALRRSLEEFESAKAELVQLRMTRGGGQRDDASRLQSNLAAERRRADANYDSFAAARADLVRALNYESALLLAYRSLRSEFMEETGGRRPRTRRPLREDEGLGAASEEEEGGGCGWDAGGEIDS